MPLIVKLQMANGVSFEVIEVLNSFIILHNHRKRTEPTTVFFLIS